MSKHTPTPWRIETDTEHGEFGTVLSDYVAGIKGGDGEWVVRFDDDYGNDQGVNAQHIVHCVNVHDQLVEALEGMMFHHQHNPVGWPQEQCLRCRSAFAAIAAAKEA